ncbi:hypothetical protein [Ferruginibacter sp. SUN106]|uniref:hypothetical protein n=1 Tax=Ferruginibacter sp. SUN106 TaxID=2978348 RepID=UPI003D3679C5
MRYLLLVCFAIAVQYGFAQDAEPYIKKTFVIIQSTKNYAAAKATAEKATKELKQKLDFRGLKPHKETGLTFSNAICKNDGGYPCYIARGRYDDGDYISIEWSDAFDKFAKGYYVVVIYSGNKTAAEITLQKARKTFKDAYAKDAAIYVGCMH